MSRQCLKVLQEKLPGLYKEQKEASREEVITSTQQFFAAVNRSNASITTGSQLASTEVCERDVVEVPDVAYYYHYPSNDCLMWNQEYE